MLRDPIGAPRACPEAVNHIWSSAGPRWRFSGGFRNSEVCGVPRGPEFLGNSALRRLPEETALDHQRQLAESIASARRAPAMTGLAEQHVDLLSAAPFDSVAL
jgi:hypothetical protein